MSGLRVWGASGQTRTLAYGTASAAVDVPEMAINGTAVRFYNATDRVVWVRFGAAGVTAATTNPSASIPISPGATEAIYAPAGATHVAAVWAAGGSGALYITPGQGV